MQGTRSIDLRDITLSDGRRLAFTAVGPADGFPVVYCHGAIGTPVQASVDIELICVELGVRYIAPFRPGIGGSDPLPGRTILDYPRDVLQLADVLELDRFDVIGVSAGGPYALALARELPDRIRRLALCSALSPFCPPHLAPGLRRRVRLPLTAVAVAPGAVRQLGDVLLPLLAAHPAIVSAAIALHAVPSERRRLLAGAERAAVCRSFLDSTAVLGASGLVEDFLTYVGGWGFDPAEVSQEVLLWHGGRDPLVPVEHALTLGAALPRCTISVDPDEGHHFFRSALPQILSTLVQSRPEVRLASPPASASLSGASRLSRNA